MIVLGINAYNGDASPALPADGRLTTSRFERSGVTVGTELPLVSIVTPSLNSEAFIEETILSVAGQTYPTRRVHRQSMAARLIGRSRSFERHDASISRWLSEADGGTGGRPAQRIRACDRRCPGVDQLGRRLPSGRDRNRGRRLAAKRRRLRIWKHGDHRRGGTRHRGLAALALHAVLLPAGTALRAGSDIAAGGVLDSRHLRAGRGHRPVVPALYGRRPEGEIRPGRRQVPVREKGPSRVQDPPGLQDIDTDSAR